MENINFESPNLKHSSSHLYPAMPQQPSSLQDFNGSHFHQSPDASGYCTTDSYLSFPAPAFDCQAVNNRSFSMQCSNKSYNPTVYQSPNFSVNQFSMKSQMNPNQFFKPSDKKSCKISSCSEFQIDPINDLPHGSYSVSFEGNQNQKGFPRNDSSPVTHLSFSSQFQQKTSSGFYSGGSVSNAAVLGSKTRIRWTQDLHEKFLQCVNRLGGAEKATPKAILKLMDSKSLTIFHIKSHLQKYRIAKYLPEPEGKSDKKICATELPQLDSKTGLQIKEALQLQLDVQRRLHEQLEIQRNLQLRIEEQGKQLKKMIDQQQRTKESFLNAQNADEPVRRSDDSSSTFTLDEIEGLMAEGSGNNTLFQSKIS